ncbi:MAG: ATP-binding protein [Muribaculaceae bacterium]|nr:ATP-binding protein [Muribaculaceae bacterium]
MALHTIKASGEYDKIFNKWFGVLDREAYNEDLLLIFCVIVGVFLLLLLFIWLLRLKVNSALRQVKYSNSELELSITAGEITAWTFDIEKQSFVAFHGKPIGEPFDTVASFYSRLKQEDIAKMRKIIRDLSVGFISEANTTISLSKDRASDEYLIFEARMVRLSQFKRIVGTLKDITEDIKMKESLENYRIKSDFIVRSNGIVLFHYELIDMEFYQLNAGENSVLSTFTYEEYLERVHPDDRQVAIEFIDKLNIGKEEHLSAEYRMLDDGNNYEWFSIEAVAYRRNELGTIISYLGLRRNNTRWKQITDDLIVLRDRAEASNRLKSASLANMSHEIRTPLNAIVGFSDLITETSDRKEQEQYKSIVKTNNDLLLRLINDILDLSKIEAGSVDFSYMAFDFSDYLRELYSSLKLREKEDVKLMLELPENTTDVFCDRNRISQLVTNFVTNAFKFTTKGSVTITYCNDAEWLTVKVIDTGIGISDEYKSKIFERFEKINEFAQGTGLGLSICKSLVESMGGNIGVESTFGEGSTFWFRLPYTLEQYTMTHKDLF